jgi:Transposase
VGGTYDVAETNRLAKTLRSWEPEILAFFDTRLTNGPTEGRNLIVKQVKRQGFGYPNPPTTGSASSTAARDTLLGARRARPLLLKRGDFRRCVGLAVIVALDAGTAVPAPSLLVCVGGSGRWLPGG